MNKPTVGKLATDLLKKEQAAVSVVDQQREMQKNYMRDLWEASDRGLNEFDMDFFIHVETKCEPLFPNVFRNYFITRKTCPTPNYDQSVFRYERKLNILQYLWSIPSRDTAFYLKEHALLLPPEEKQILQFVMHFADGTLFRLCKQLNGEKLDSPELDKKDITFAVTE